METPEDLAEMSVNLNENPQLLDKVQDDGDTPLISAVQIGHEKCVKFLLEHKPNLVNVSRIANPLCRAVFMYQFNRCISTDKFYNIINMLLDSGCKTNSWINENIETKYQLFVLVIFGGHARLVKLFLNYYVNVVSPNTNSNYSYLNEALVANRGTEDSEIVRLLLESGAQLTFGRKDSLEIALYAGYSKPVKYVLMYHGSPIVHAPGCQIYIYSYRKVISCIVPVHCKLATKVEMLNLLHKFGVNLWINEVQYEYESEELDNLYNETNKIRGQPLSLKCLSRIKIMHSMGRNFVKKYKELEIPNDLHEFLEFPDV
jgi:ankyrin repeat protein